jgi:PadR family transcriptional regulator, regulatory protein PadR
MPQNDLPSLSAKEYLIMNMLIGARREMYGLELVEQSQGELKRGTIYVTLNRLEEKGYVSSKKEPEAKGIASPRRMYKTTGLGERVFRALEAAGGRAWLREVYA